jgi:hypothetical protein
MSAHYQMPFSQSVQYCPLSRITFSYGNESAEALSQMICLRHRRLRSRTMHRELCIVQNGPLGSFVAIGLPHGAEERKKR